MHHRLNPILLSLLTALPVALTTCPSAGRAAPSPDPPRTSPAWAWAAALKDAQSLDSARNAVANTKQTQAQAKLKDAQSIAQARTGVTNAKQSLQATQAANTVKATPQNANVVSAATSVASRTPCLRGAR